jgi:uncharacterized protein (TIGR00725 family)
MRKVVVGVMGGASVSSDVAREAEELGSLVGGQGWILLNGGRACGVMDSSARGAREAGGLTVGILPESTREGASAHCDVQIVTGMGAARNVINVLSSDVVIACPGGAGTLSEVALALKYGRRVILLGMEVGPALDRYRATGQLGAARNPEDAVEKVLAARGSTDF